MLTDTEGIDFNDYLRRVYLTVQRNWFSVMPASVQLGDQGVVSLQFKIMRDGSVPDGDPAQVFSSGKEPLDRAAFSSIRASNPFQPLPQDSKRPTSNCDLRITTICSRRGTSCLFRAGMKQRRLVEILRAHQKRRSA